MSLIELASLITRIQKKLELREIVFTVQVKTW